MARYTIMEFDPDIDDFSMRGQFDTLAEAQVAFDALPDLHTRAICDSAGEAVISRDARRDI